VRTSLAAAFVVLAAALFPFFAGKGLAYLEVLWAHRGWSVATMGLWFVMVKYLARRLMELSMHRPGSRLRAGEDV
jgi:hypothetical protein